MSNRMMQKFSLPAICLFLSAISADTVYGQNAQPTLSKINGVSRLYVSGKPYLILGGELGNSTSSNAEYMRPIWPKLTAMHLNTVLVPVYWELLEPAEGKFDFTLLD